MDYIISIDGGGTSTKCVVVSADGTVLSRSQAGPSNFRRIGIEATLRNVSQAAQAATADAGIGGPVQFGSFCIAGARHPDGRELIEPGVRALRLADHFYLSHDCAAALAGAHALQSGVVVIAGTGAVAYGLDEGGKEAFVDGGGPLLGDEGSAYWIGLRVLRAVMRAQDGRGEPTSLTQQVLTHYGLEDELALIPHLPLDRTNSGAIAQLAPLCGIAAQGGDAAAQGILHCAAHRLARSAGAAVRTLDLGAAPRVAATGGVMADKLLAQAFEAAMRTDLPNALLAPPRLPAVLGAALIGLRESGAGTGESIAAKLLQTWRETAAPLQGRPA